MTNSLEELAKELEQSFTGARFSFINTRILLRTGVDLREIRPDQKEDPSTLERVIKVVGELGLNPGNGDRQ